MWAGIEEEEGLSDASNSMKRATGLQQRISLVCDEAAGTVEILRESPDAHR
jgi:hypothetical protein